MMQTIERKATFAQLKNHNQKLVLNTIYSNLQISRAAISRITHLARPTVSSLVADLISEGLVETVGISQSQQSGKPATMLSIAENSRTVIGIDLSRYRLQGSAINLRGKIKYRHQIQVQGPDQQFDLDLIFQLIDELIKHADSRIIGIGIGTPGLINTRNRIVRNAVNMKWINLPLGNFVEDRYHLPVYIANDCQTAAIGEYNFGQNRSIANMAMIIANYGVGAGIIIDGRIYYGDNSHAGEIGHLVVQEGGELCKCGKRGCLETVASCNALIRKAQKVFEEHPQSILRQFVDNSQAVTFEHVLRAFQAGDPYIKTEVEHAGRYLGFAVAILVTTLDIERIILGGHLALFGDFIIDVIQDEMNRRTMGLLTEKTSLHLSQLDEDVVMLGMAAQILNFELGILSL